MEKNGVIVIQPETIDKLLEVSPRAVKMFLQLCKVQKLRNKETIKISVRYLAKCIGVDKMTAHRAISELLFKGLVVRHSFYRSKNGKVEGRSYYSVLGVLFS